MLDIKFIRQNPDLVRKNLTDRQVEFNLSQLLEIDERRKQVLQAIEDIRAKKNKASKAIAHAKDEKEKEKIILEMKELDKGADRLNKSFRRLEKKFNDLMLKLPNLLLDDVPRGKDEKDNLVLEEIGEKRVFDFENRSYLELAEKLDLIDIKRAAKISGSRFAFLKNDLVFLELALINFAFENLVSKGFIPIFPPMMIKKEMAQGMGYLEQTNDEEAYYLPKDDLYLIGTSEQPLGAMHAKEFFQEKELPRRYVAFSSCFRREAGSWGKDTKGIFRLHQFDKIEMFTFSKPEDSKKEHLFLVENQKKLMESLKIPFRVVKLCSGDLAKPSASTIDIECWIPSENRYRETHSASNCTDFQARRLNIRYLTKQGKLRFVHTLNATAIAIPRILIAIIENYQQKDGTILVPEVLQKYTKFEVIPSKK
jgi:seryl-tRNA synthetase